MGETLVPGQAKRILPGAADPGTPVTNKTGSKVISRV